MDNNEAIFDFGKPKKSRHTDPDSYLAPLAVKNMKRIEAVDQVPSERTLLARILSPRAVQDKICSYEPKYKVTFAKRHLKRPVHGDKLPRLTTSYMQIPQCYQPPYQLNEWAYTA